MNFRIILLFILSFFLFSSLTYTLAQKRVPGGGGVSASDSTRTNNQDSIKAARAQIADSIKQVHAYITDSIKAARKVKSDSMMAVRKHFTDSTAAIHKYHDSKHYRDSVANARLTRTNALKQVREAHMDSLKDARTKITDSLTAIRKAKTDSIKTIQKRRSDSLAVIKKYKASRRYADSVSIVRHDHMDSITTAREHFRDSIAAVRKHTLDSTKTVRQHTMDSVKTVRTKFLDSIKIVRKARADSFAKVKADREKMLAAKEKKKQESMKLKLELKMKQKHEKWSNKSMLKKKWSPFRRGLQNSFTHYNYYYNANKKMDEALLNMQRTKKENYDSLIGLYPYDPNRDSSTMKGDMDSIVHKISVAIQIHDPRVKWSNDLYLLLGEAYYYKGNYNNASIAFRYIISADEAAKKKKAAALGNIRSKEAPSIVEEEKKSRLDFLKHKSVHNESILWLARTYTESHQPENAESIMSLLESDTKLPENLKGRVAMERAFAYLMEKNYPEASTQLDVAVADNNLPSWLRVRAAFLNGQLLQQMGQYADAAASFERALDFYPKLEMDFYTRKYIAFNKLQAGVDVAEAMRPLKKVLNDAKYVTYYDQVYFVLGQLAVKANKPDEAITYLTKSTQSSKASKNQKAISFAALGDVYYSVSRYNPAKMAYDSAAKYASAGSKDTIITNAIKRSKGLAEISGPAGVIHDQDSLLALSALSKKEQLATVREYLRELEQHLQDSIEAAETAGVNSVAQTEPDNSGTDAANWYFSNPTQMEQGSADFKRKWGTRTLTDNWRRASANALANNSSDNDEDGGKSGTANNGLPSEESLLAKIPNTPQQKQLCAKLEERAYMLLAKAYVKQLSDYNQALNTLDTMDARYPNNGQQEEDIYLRYQIAMKQSQFDKAQTYSAELLDKFPHSQYAALLRPKQSESRPVASAGPEAPYYDETYTMIMQHQYAEALTRIGVASQQYDDPVYKKRFQVAEAMSYAGMGNFGVADSLITGFLKVNQGDTLAAWASSVQEYIKEVRNGGMPSWYKDWPPKEDSINRIADAKKAAQKKAQQPPPPPPVVPVPEQYAYKADSEHYCIILLPGLDSKTASLKQGIKKFDSANFATANLDMLLDLYDIGDGVLVIQKFKNSSEAKVYMDSLVNSTVFHDYKPDELKVFIITKDNYKKMYADKRAQPYITFYKAYYQ